LLRTFEGFRIEAVGRRSRTSVTVVAHCELHHCDVANWNARQVDGKDASLMMRQVVGRDLAAVRFDAPSAERQAQTQAAAVDASLHEGAEQIVDVSGRQTAACVLNLDQDARGAGTDA
jgi:hypothetical protein